MVHSADDRSSNDRPAAPFREGEMLAGKYRVEKVIGQGGMGLVLAAEHVALHQRVAIKLLHDAALAHTDVVGRFMREARASVRLRSEHVARVMDVGSLDDGRPFIVMEHLVGEDLGDVIEKSGPLPVSTSVDYVLQACEAIAEAHGAGIVHRDLKPTNLFLTHTVHGKPLVKVLDFGISKVDPATSPQEAQLTKTTEVIGSPSYMSPEQLRSSRNVDTRTDIWALGVILYELLTGRVPFAADTMTELVVVIVTERAPILRSHRPDIPEGLAAIVARCLEKQAEHRFQTVLELVRALQPYASIAEATASERIQAISAGGAAFVAAQTAPMSSATVPAPFDSSRQRVAVHGGTSVAWGETQSQVGAAPFGAVTLRSGPSRKGLYLALAAAAVVSTIGAVAATSYFAKRTSATATAGNASAMPLPEGRKDLPPLPTSSAPPAVATEAPAPSASALPDTRKLAPAPSASTKPPPTPAVKSRPTTPKSDDLNDIGRR